jgi:hypothetical protein
MKYRSQYQQDRTGGRNVRGLIEWTWKSECEWKLRGNNIVLLRKKLGQEEFKVPQKAHALVCLYGESKVRGTSNVHQIMVGISWS